MTNKTTHPHAAETRRHLLHELDLLRKDHSGTFDRLTRIVTKVLDAPVSLVTMVEQDYQWFLGCTGLKKPYSDTRCTPLSHSFCQHVTASKSALVIEDAREHDLVAHNLAIRDLDVIAYLGIPLVTTDGVALGSFCVIDDKPRQWTAFDIELMQELAFSVMTEIELRYELKQREEAEQLLAQSIRQREQLRIVKEMSRAISHDLRTPLSSIRIKVDLLGRQITEAKTAEQITYIQKKLDDVRHILDDFTQLWDLDKPQDPFEGAVDIHQLIVHAIASITNQFPERTVAIVPHLNANQRVIVARSHLMRVMLEHVLDNAVRYNTDPIEIIVATKNEANSLVICIKDNGIGIPTDDLSRIFDPMYRVDKARKNTSDKIGLGLTIVQQIINDHNGNIAIESETDNGTEVIIKLPL